MTILTVAAGGRRCSLRRQRRAALFAVGVMIGDVARDHAASSAGWAATGRTGRTPSTCYTQLQLPVGPRLVRSAAFAGVLVDAARALRAPRQPAPARHHAGRGAGRLLVCLDRVLLGRHFPTDVIGGVAARRSSSSSSSLAFIDPRPRCHAANAEPLPEVFTTERRLAVILNPIKVEDVGQFRADRRRDGQGVGLVRADLALHDDRGPRHRHGRGGRRSPAPTWCSSAAATARCARSAPSSPAPASRSGSSRPAPATCWPATSTSRSTSARPSTSRSTARTGRSTWCEVGGDGIEDTHFMVMAGMGFDAAIMEGVNEDIKKKIGWIAYVVSGLKSLMFPAIKVEISDRRRGAHHPPGPHRRRRQRRLPAGRHAAAARRHDRRRHPRRRDHPPAPVPVLDPAGLAGAAQEHDRRRDARPADRRARCGSRPPPTPRASSTATRSARAASSGWSASTAGCWSASPAEHARRPRCNAGLVLVPPWIYPGGYSY